MPFPTARQVSLPACSSDCPSNAERQEREAVSTNFTVIGLTPFGIKPKFTAPEADAPTTESSEHYNLSSR